MDDLNNLRPAPGAPGIAPRWISSAKSGVGTAFDPVSRVWFTLGYGILDEIYHPRVDRASTRDMGFIVTDGQNFFSEEKRDTDSKVSYIEEGVPAYHLINTCKQGYFRIEKDVIADPMRNVVLQRVQFIPLQGSLADYHLYALLAPHLGNQGAENTAWLGDYKGVPMLFAKRADEALAMACSQPWLRRSVGYVGTSDGWQDLSQHKQMTWEYTSAEEGNVAVVGEIDLAATEGRFVVAIGFEPQGLSAGYAAWASILAGFDSALKHYAAPWKHWQNSLLHLESPDDHHGSPYRVSTAVLKVHEAKDFQGGLIASLSTPWGASKGDETRGGYHIVWTRDLVEGVGGLMAAGAAHEVRSVLHYLHVTQEADGHWTQNMWLDGLPYMTGIQIDEVSFPVLLTEQAWREGLITATTVEQLWPMVRKAIGFIVCNGPVTEQDRWEDNAGYSPFTLASEITALLSAAQLAEQVGEADLAEYLRETADLWNDGIERWTYVTDTELAHQCGVEGYYIYIAPPGTADSLPVKASSLTLHNQPSHGGQLLAATIVSPDALALVRFGLRAADDMRILNTIRVIDQTLKVETPFGPVWHRYNNDGYGEHEDGSPYDGTGIGRAWPLLTGERAHYEIAAGRLEAAQRLLKTMESFSGESGMFPEQVWDTDDIPERSLYCGRPSGSAMPLVWAHAEHIKLRRSLREGRVFDMPPHPVQRYLEDQKHSPYFLWRFNHQVRWLSNGKQLRIEITASARIHWSTDDWNTAQDVETHTTGLGNHLADLPTESLKSGAKIAFTFYWLQADRWEGENFEIRVV
jgi:glucoamylase